MNSKLCAFTKIREKLKLVMDHAVLLVLIFLVDHVTHLEDNLHESIDLADSHPLTRQSPDLPVEPFGSDL